MEQVSPNIWNGDVYVFVVGKEEVFCWVIVGLVLDCESGNLRVIVHQQRDERRGGNRQQPWRDRRRRLEAEWSDGE